MILQVAGEILCVDFGLLENSAQGASGEFVVQGNDATHCLLFSDFLQNNVTSALTNLTETNRSNARIASAPETRGSLCISRLEDRDDWVARIVWRKFFQIKLGSLAEIGYCFFNSLALADRADLRTLRYVQVTFFMQHRSKGSNMHESAPVDSTT